MKAWKNIWENREVTNDHLTLNELIKVDGFDSGFGTLQENDWIQYIRSINDILNIQSTDSIYEIGCGSGALLYPFYKNGHIVGGLDYSKKLLQLASKCMKNMNFDLLSAENMDITIKYDIIISNSVFQYFPTKEYAKDIVLKMLHKSNGKIAILDLNDSSKKKQAVSIRQGTLSKKEYIKKYEGLDQLYYEKAWFEKIALENGYHIKIWDQNIKNYKNSEYRFNVYMKKHREKNFE